MTTDVRTCPCTPFPQIVAAETVPPAFWGKEEKKAWCAKLHVQHSRFDSKWQELGYITGVIHLDGKSNTIDAVAMRATTDSELIERCTLQVGPRVCSIVDVLGKRQLPAEKRITVDDLQTLVCINRQSDSCVVFQTDISSADLEEARQCLQILQFSRVTMLRYFNLQHGDSGPALKKAMEQVVTGYTGEKPIARKAKTMAKQTSFVRHKGAVKCDPTSRVVFRMETNHLVVLTIKINGELGVPAVTFAIPCFKS